MVRGARAGTLFACHLWMNIHSLITVSHRTNFVGIPTEVLASAAFNEHPQRLRISGACVTNPALFRMLDDSTSTEEGADAFQKYMAAVFGIDSAPVRREDGTRFHASYRQLLQGWGFDANSRQGAVLKGWVESRFGLMPTFHRQQLGHYPSPAWMRYVTEKMSGRFHNNSIYQQLDLLYEFCQWMLAHYCWPGRSHLTLYRGVNDFDEHALVRRFGRREALVYQNNLVSFSDQREVAEQFGDTILEARIPLVKLLFFNGLLPGPVLTGEGEYLVIGGEYRVKMTYF